MVGGQTLSVRMLWFVGFLLERRLRQVGRRISALREEMAVADEQLAHFADLADEEHRHAERTTSAMARHRADMAAELARLEAEQDDLLDRMLARQG